MTARIIIVATLVVALVAGASLYWLQEYAFYREVEASSVALVRTDGTAVARPVRDFRGIDSDSSPIRHRSCFTFDAPPTDLRPYPGARPLNGPRWFGCFDARAIGEALEAGEATAVLGGPAAEGIDRVVALFPDGRAYAWTQIDPCGALVDEDERPALCTSPEGP